MLFLLKIALRLLRPSSIVEGGSTAYLKGREDLPWPVSPSRLTSTPDPSSREIEHRLKGFIEGQCAQDFLQAMILSLHNAV